MSETLRLLRLAAAHVYRQQFAGKHEQDRQDAEELSPQITAHLREHMANTKKKTKKKSTKKTTNKKKPPPRTPKKTTKKPIPRGDHVQEKILDQLHNVDKRLEGLEDLDLEEALTFAIGKIEELETRLVNVEKMIANAMGDDDGTE